jgi:hypothetical protein
MAVTSNAKRLAVRAVLFVMVVAIEDCGGSTPSAPTNQTVATSYTESGPFPPHSTGCSQVVSVDGPASASVSPVLGKVTLSTGGCVEPPTPVLGQSDQGCATVAKMPGGLNRVIFSNDSDTTTRYELRVSYQD